MSHERNVDPYVEVADIIARLKRVDLVDEADALQDAMDSGSTGTEIFMELRWHLEELLKSNLSDNLREKATTLEAFLARALR